MYKVITGMPRTLWLPDGAEFLDVEIAGREPIRVAATTIGERWTLPTK